MDGLQLTWRLLLLCHCFHQIESYEPFVNKQHHLHDVNDMGNDESLEGCTCGEDIIDRPSQLGDNLVVVMSHEGIPCDGEVSAWEFWANQTGTFRAFIARPVGSNFEIIGVNDITVTSAMFGQSISYGVPQNGRIRVQTGDMIGVGNFDMSNNPYIKATNRAGLNFQYATMDPNDLDASFILTVPYSFQGTSSLAVVISPATEVNTTPPPIFTTSGHATTPRPIFTTSGQDSTDNGATTPQFPTTIRRATTPNAIQTTSPEPTGCTCGEDIIDRPSQLGDNLVVVMSHEIIPCDGEVSAWEFWASQTGSFRAFVARPVGSNFEIIGVNDITVTSAMFGQSASYVVPQNERIRVQTGDMIGVGNFDSLDNPYIQATNYAGIDFHYATMDPNDLEANLILSVPNTWQGTNSVAVVVSPVTESNTTPNPIFTTSGHETTANPRFTTSGHETTPKPRFTTSGHETTPKPRFTTSVHETTPIYTTSGFDHETTPKPIATTPKVIPTTSNDLTTQRNHVPTTFNQNTPPPEPIITTNNEATFPPNPEPTTGIDTFEILDCAKDSMTAYVPRSVIGNAVDGSHLHFIDTSCTGTNHNATHVEMSTAFNRCGTTMEVGDDYVIFANIIIDDALPVTPTGDITRDKTIEIPVQCKMEKDALASVSFDPDTSKIIYREEGYGKFSFNLQLYEDGSYVNPYPPEDYPIDVNLRDMLYFEAEVEAQQGLELFVETCAATPLNDPNSSPKYEFLHNGCSSDNTFQFFSSPDPMIERFGLEAFAFVGLHGPVYVHCYLMLCNVTDPSSRCNQGCIAKNDIIKRSAGHSGSKSYRMTRGPFELNAEEQVARHAGNNVDDNSPGVMIACVGLMALCVIISAVAITKSTKKDRSQYMIVPNFDVEAKTQAKQVQK